MALISFDKKKNTNNLGTVNFFQRWPTEVPDLQPTTKTLFDLLSLVGDRVLSVMALGLGLVRTEVSVKGENQRKLTLCVLNLW